LPCDQLKVCVKSKAVKRQVGIPSPKLRLPTWPAVRVCCGLSTPYQSMDWDRCDIIAISNHVAVNYLSFKQGTQHSVFLSKIDSSQSLAIELAGANSRDWLHGRAAAYTAQDLPSASDPRRERTREESSEPAVHGRFAQKSLVLLRLPARQRPKSIYLRRHFSSSHSLPFSIHPLPYQHLTALSLLLQQYLRFVSTSTTITSLPERSHPVGFCQQRHSQDHTYIHPVR
jgi:hypothetical protein